MIRAWLISKVYKDALAPPGDRARWGRWSAAKRMVVVAMTPLSEWPFRYDVRNIFCISLSLTSEKSMYCSPSVWYITPFILDLIFVWPQTPDSSLLKGHDVSHLQVVSPLWHSAHVALSTATQSIQQKQRLAVGSWVNQPAPCRCRRKINLC